jgi:hypothetical protein
MRQKHFLMKIVAAWEPAGRKQQFDPDNVFSSAIPLPPVGLEQ